MIRKRQITFLFALGLISVDTLHADTIELTDGTSLSGTLVDTQAGYLRLELPDTNGQALRRIHPSQVSSLTFSDTQSELSTQALLRSQFIPLLSQADAQLLPAYLEQLLETDQALAALSYAKLWHPKNNYPNLDPIYRSLLLRSATAAKLPAETLIHAQNWTSQPAPPYADPLPWKILAQHHLDTGQPEAALWVALRPLAHATTDQQATLAPLHPLAAQAYQELGYPDQAAAHLSQNSSLIIHPSSFPIPPPPPSLLAESLTYPQLLKTNSQK